MPTYYCHECAVSAGHLQPMVQTNLTASTYLLDKFIKHTVPSARYPLVSVFDTADYDVYRDYVVNAHVSGSVEVDDRNRTNIVWCAAEKTGVMITNGVPVHDTDAVKVVLHDRLDVHGFPTGSAGFVTATCATCGRLIVR